MKSFSSYTYFINHNFYVYLIYPKFKTPVNVNYCDYFVCGTGSESCVLAYPTPYNAWVQLFYETVRNFDTTGMRLLGENISSLYVFHLFTPDNVRVRLSSLIRTAQTARLLKMRVPQLDRSRPRSLYFFYAPEIHSAPSPNSLSQDVGLATEVPL